MHRTQLRSVALFLALVSAVVLGDQITKHLARKHLTTDRFDAIHADVPACTDSVRQQERKRFLRTHGRPKHIVPLFFDLRYAENCGSSFNLLLAAPEWFRYPLFITTALLTLVVSAVFLIKKKPRRSTAVGWALFFAGTAGNLIDRLTHRYVIDFLHFHLFFGKNFFSFPKFNLADVAITSGALLLVASLWRGMNRQ